MMRRFLHVTILVALLFVAGAAHSDSGTFLAASNTTGATTAIDSGGASYVGVHIWRSDDAAASTSSVYLQVSMDGVAWYRAATFTNVTGLDGTSGDGGDAVSVPSWPFMRLYVASCSVGRLSSKWVTR